MACRIQNLGKHRLALDLRGGGVIYLNPNEVSQPIREELLYHHIHLPHWLADGRVRRIDAKMSEVFAHEQKSGTTLSAEEPAPGSVDTLAVKDAESQATSDAKDTEKASGENSELHKTKPKGRAKDSSAKTQR